MNGKTGLTHRSRRLAPCHETKRSDPFSSHPSAGQSIRGGFAFVRGSLSRKHPKFDRSRFAAVWAAHSHFTITSRNWQGVICASLASARNFNLRRATERRASSTTRRGPAARRLLCAGLLALGHNQLRASHPPGPAIPTGRQSSQATEPGARRRSLSPPVQPPPL